ncbi:hypothetical protein B1C78_03060 [Thioalkalivibrio denitrificans]|uniref:Copper oxidase n=1 Tax=Thioalkalivibrio denitrificans TaxID=108003 RepID=A0A1V3NSD6_9GAMM|nr:copper oxidase [Thioalkalivibrio denitrificans]OOG27646.1 hypothetical protein B1C78_03060 [Thioalkalivibrio denitrificans]
MKDKRTRTPENSGRRQFLRTGLAMGGLAVSSASLPVLAQSARDHGDHDMHQMHEQMHGNGHAGHDAHGEVDAKTLRAMMGYDRVEDIPLRGPADAVARLPYTERDGVKEFELTAEPIRWAYAEGRTILAWGYNGQVPGPEIRATEGDRVRIRFTNNLPVPTSLHWHGLHVPFAMDGVPGVTQKAVMPGETFVYEFDAVPAGTRFYHTHGSHHGDESVQMDMGLSGSFIVEPKDGSRSFDKEMTLLLGEWQLGAEGMNQVVATGGHEHEIGGDHATGGYNLFTLNGRSYPDVPSLKVREGERVRIRMINAGSMSIHPMHIHGHSFEVVAIDGNAVPEAARQMRDVVTLAPGERFDVEFTADNPGIWVLHCHELHHAAMGMIMLIEYEGFEAEAKAPPPATAPAGHAGHHGH